MLRAHFVSSRRMARAPMMISTAAEGRSQRDRRRSIIRPLARLATVIAATLGVTDLDQIEDIDRIRRAHLLLAMFNALQPGVFALSGWDMCGMLTLPTSEISQLLQGGDTRWINRAAHDLMGVNPQASHSSAGMPRGRSLYGSIPEQLADETSFLRQLQAILKVRSHYGIATSTQIDIPDGGPAWPTISSVPPGATASAAARRITVRGRATGACR